MIWQRIKKIWELSSPPKPKQFTWNGEPIAKEKFKSNMGFKTTTTPNTPARFIARVKEDPIKRLINENAS